MPHPYTCSSFPKPGAWQSRAEQMGRGEKEERQCLGPSGEPELLVDPWTAASFDWGTQVSPLPSPPSVCLWMRIGPALGERSRPQFLLCAAHQGGGACE